MTDADGLTLFADEINPGLVARMRPWEGDSNLGRLWSALRSHTERKAFLDTYAEALIALHLTARGCRLRFEVPTPRGRRCDFEVERGELKFYLHLKRLDTDRPARNPRKLLEVSSSLRVLERIARPYIVQVRWLDELRHDQVQRLVKQAAEFIHHARLGDELRAVDVDGREIGGVRIVAPWDGPHVSVTMGLPSGFIDHAPRFRRLLQRAYQQFMPRAANVILIASSHEGDSADFENALLGSHIERWDAFPPRGQRLAHGRDVDGFWHARRFSESNLAGWFCFSHQRAAVHIRLWQRDVGSMDQRTRAMIQDLFAPGIR